MVVENKCYDFCGPILDWFKCVEKKKRERGRGECCWCLSFAIQKENWQSVFFLCVKFINQVNNLLNVKLIHFNLK